jgi:hypothetical protein
VTRWNDDYVLVADGDFEEFWENRAEERPRESLYVLGAGFDPRASLSPSRFLSARGRAGVSILRLALRPSPLPNDEQDWVAQNRNDVDAVAAEAGVEIDEIDYPDVADPKSAGVVVVRELVRAGRFAGCDDVVVDVSALPVDVYFALIGGLLRARSQDIWTGDLFVVACENPDLDDAIVQEGAEDVAYLPGFSLPPEALKAGPRIWVPVLGRGRADQTRRVFDETESVGSCSCAPFSES